MQYMLLIYSTETTDAAVTPQQLVERVGAYRAYTEDMIAKGVWVAGDRLQATSNATTVRAEGGAAQIHDGPFAETKEQLGGYYLIEAPDLDAALGWAKKCPAVHYGSVEVRPLFAMPG